MQKLTVSHLIIIKIFLLVNFHGGTPCITPVFPTAEKKSNWLQFKK